VFLLQVDQRVTGAPFIYQDDIREFDFEFTRWNVSNNNNRYAPVHHMDTTLYYV
jgi:hypothetical protein